MLEPAAGLGGLARTKKGNAILQTPDSGSAGLGSDDMGQLAALSASVGTPHGDGGTPQKAVRSISVEDQA